MIPSTDFIKPSGLVHLTLLNKDGEIKKQLTVPNLVVQSGLNHIALRMSAYWLTPVGGNLPDPIANEMGFMALGASNTAVSLSNSSLLSPLGSRVAVAPAPNGSKAQISVPLGGPATVTYTGLFTAGNATGTVVEAGVFNAATSGTMLCRTVFPAINKLETDSLAITWTITIS